TTGVALVAPSRTGATAATGAAALSARSVAAATRAAAPSVRSPALPTRSAALLIGTTTGGCARAAAAPYHPYRPAGGRYRAGAVLCRRGCGWVRPVPGAGRRRRTRAGGDPCVPHRPAGRRLRLRLRPAVRSRPGPLHPDCVRVGGAGTRAGPAAQLPPPGRLRGAG